MDTQHLEGLWNRSAAVLLLAHSTLLSRRFSGTVLYVGAKEMEYLLGS
tara:strand:- start:146 stop:289 length:144 start_codon:yes stop_codon:yes gene_type:complete